MSNKRHNFKYPVQFLPRSFGDLLKDDPTASKNVIVPLEPESWKHGVYFNDGYDYEQHLVTIEDFRDETKSLPTIDYNKNLNMHPIMATKTAKVISEFEVNEGHLVTEDINTIDNIEIIKEIERNYDNIALDKLRTIAKNDVDEDILFALENAKEVYELNEDDIFEDNFIELADVVPNKSKCDNDLMHNLFFGNSNVDKDMEVIEEDNNNDNFYNFTDNIKGSINEISRMQYDYGNIKKLKLSEENSTSMSTVSLSFINRLERHKEKQDEKKEFIKSTDEDLKKFIVFEDTEYNVVEVNREVRKWCHRNKPVESDALDVHGRVSKIKPKQIRIEKIKKKDNTNEEMDTCYDDSDTQSTSTVINVSQIHIPRPQNESTEDKKMRKRLIKIAKRERHIQKKDLKNTFAALS